jgi:hypothetical protein
MTIADAAKAIGDFTGTARYTNRPRPTAFFSLYCQKSSDIRRNFEGWPSIPAMAPRTASDRRK